MGIKEQEKPESRARRVRTGEASFAQRSFPIKEPFHRLIGWCKYQKGLEEFYSIFVNTRLRFEFAKT